MILDDPSKEKPDPLAKPKAMFWISGVNDDTYKRVSLRGFEGLNWFGKDAPKPRGMAMGLSGLQLIRSDGNLWSVIGNTAVPRVGTAVTGITGRPPTHSCRRRKRSPPRR